MQKKTICHGWKILPMHQINTPGIFFRLQLIPAIKEAYPNVENNLLHNLDRFREAELLYKQSIDLHKQKLIEQKGMNGIFRY